METSEQVNAPLLTDVVAFDAAKFKNALVLNNGSAKAMVFALKAGQAVPPHSTPTDALLTVLEGSGTVTIAATSHVVQRGGYVVMPMGSEHHIKATTDMKFLLVK
jgi:quercetin dioxygenase-like cupin family protein